MYSWNWMCVCFPTYDGVIISENLRNFVHFATDAILTTDLQAQTHSAEHVVMCYVTWYQLLFIILLTYCLGRYRQTTSNAIRGRTT